MTAESSKERRRIPVFTVIVASASALMLVFMGYMVMWNLMNRYGFNLPGGFRLMQHFDEVWIQNMDFKTVPPFGRFAVGPNVVGYRVFSNAIIGKVSPHPKYRDEQNKFPLTNRELRPGYFIVDVNTKTVIGGLTKDDWLRKLYTFRIIQEPELYVPTSRDEKMGRNKPYRPGQP